MTDTQKEKGGEMPRQKKNRRLSSSLIFVFGLSSRFSVGREASSEEAAAQNLNSIQPVFLCMCVFG